MHLGLVWLLSLAPAAMPGAFSSPPTWSPDGRWLAFTVATSYDRPELSPGWLFDTARPGDRGARRPEAAPMPRSFGLFATGIEDESPVLIEDSPRPLSSPAWRPDGRCLAYLRLDDADPDRAKLEVVLREGLGARRVLATLALRGESVPGAGEVSSLVPSWSPDGRFLAAPLAGGPGFTVLRADNGAVVKTVADGVWPVWSPEGSRIAYVRPGISPTLRVLDPGLGPSRTLADLGVAFQPPVWVQNGSAVLAVVRRETPRGFGTSRSIDVVLVRMEPAERRGLPAELRGVGPDFLARIGSDAPARKLEWKTVSAVLSRDGDDLFHASEMTGEPHAIVWFHPRTGDTVNRFHPLDYTVRIGALALSPGGKTLAFRAGPPGPSSPVGIWEVGTGKFAPVAPDDRTREAWITFLVQSGRELLRKGLPPAVVDGRVITRTTILPIPGEITMTQEIGLRLGRVGRIGRTLCDRENESGPVDPGLAELLPEARLFFDLLRDDYPAARTSLDELESRCKEPEGRVKLLSLRAQVALGLGQSDRARDVVAFLRAEARKSPTRFEVTPAGFSLTPEPDGLDGWVSYLARRVEERGKTLVPTRTSDDETRPGPIVPDLTIRPRALNAPFGRGEVEGGIFRRNFVPPEVDVLRGPPPAPRPIFRGRRDGPPGFPPPG